MSSKETGVDPHDVPSSEAKTVVHKPKAVPPSSVRPKKPFSNGPSVVEEANRVDGGEAPGKTTHGRKRSSRNAVPEVGVASQDGGGELESEVQPSTNESASDGFSGDIPSASTKKNSGEVLAEEVAVPGSFAFKSMGAAKAVLDFVKAFESNRTALSAAAAAQALSGFPSSAVRENEEKAAISKRRHRSAAYVSEFVKNHPDDKALISAIEGEIKQIVSEHAALEGYEVIFLYDFNFINRTHVSGIYQALASCQKRKNILLVLKSPGGEVEPAYLISKLCNRMKRDKFVVGVPAEAKSAATLLSLGADEIHMGAMSELGPIDPQINGYPALAFSSALEKIAELAEKYPGASEMLALYLKESGLNVQDLGHHDRITESSTQYALRLLESKATDTQTTDKLRGVAEYFTNHYKDHGFVIDVEEAQKLLTSEVVISEGEIYHACHDMHKFLELCEFSLQIDGRKKKVFGLGQKFFLRSV